MARPRKFEKLAAVLNAGGGFTAVTQGNSLIPYLQKLVDDTVKQGCRFSDDNAAYMPKTAGEYLQKHASQICAPDRRQILAQAIQRQCYLAKQASALTPAIKAAERTVFPILGAAVGGAAGNVLEGGSPTKKTDANGNPNKIGPLTIGGAVAGGGAGLAFDLHGEKLINKIMALLKRAPK